MNMIKAMAALAVAGVLAGCAQQEEPTLVRAEPIYNKYGDGACEGGLIYVPGTVPQRDECIPPEECEPVYDSTGQVIECLPPRRPQRPGSDSSDSDRQPTAPRPTSPAGGFSAVRGTSAPAT